MIINNNIPALNTYRQLTMNNSNSSRAMEKLSSGFRINRAGDDAAGLAISEKMRAQIRGLNQAQRNAQDSISMVQTAEGALQETQSILQRMRELATQAANDTNVAVDRTEIQKEINQLTSEINRIGNTTEFNTQRLLNGDKANTLQTLTGNFSVSGTNTAALTGLTGVSNVTLTSGLSADTHTLTITRTGQAHDAVQISASNVDSGTGVNIGANFSSGINITAGAGATGSNIVSGSFVVLYDHTAQTIKISGTGSSGTISDTVNLVDGKINYDNLGISFNFNASGLTGDGSLSFGGAASGAMTLSTNTLGYALANSGVDGWATNITVGTPNVSGSLSGAGDLPDEVMNWTVTLSGAAGVNGFRISGVGANGTIIKDAVAADVSTTATAYAAYGISFTIDTSTSAGNANDKITFTTTPKFTYSAQIDSGTAVAIASGVGQSGLTGNYTVNGVSFTADHVIGMGQGSSASGTFEVTTAKQIGADNSLTFQIGANQSQSMSLSISDMRSKAIGVSTTDASTQWVEISRKHDALVDAGIMKSGGTSGVGGEAGKWYIEASFTTTTDVTNGTNAAGVEKALDMSTHTKAAAAVTVINDAIERVSAERSKLGASQNRLEHTINNLGTSAENLTAAESRIRDVDMAREMMNFTKNNILSQAAQAMLAQANQAPQSVLQLLR